MTPSPLATLDKHAFFESLTPVLVTTLSAIFLAVAIPVALILIFRTERIQAKLTHQLATAKKLS